MPATAQARPRLWPLGLAIAACLFTAVMLLGGHSTSSAATPRAMGPRAADTTFTVTAPPSVVTTVVTSVSTIYVPKTQTQTQTQTQTDTKTVTALPAQATIFTTNTAHVTAHQTQINQINQTQVHQVITTNSVGETITANVTTVKTRQVVNVHDLTSVQTSQVFATATNTVNQTLAPAAVAKPTKSLASRARVAIGAGGVAVTSAAAFGFLMLRRRGRYT
ncbi:MAG: hypothetical protein M3O28_08080 [Actinomycetota bacterium]|nr:hypothetical protein [Actinomycetota bacterium]